MPTWLPDRAEPPPRLPALTVVYDAGDDKAFMDWALAVHAPPAGRITVHPAPAAGAPAALAHDLLRALGKHLPLAGSEEGVCWTRDARTAWRTAAAWIWALRIGHVLLTRAHLITVRHLERLFALAHLTGIRLALVCHGPLAPEAAAAVDSLGPQTVHTLAAARRSVPTAPAAVTAGRYPWWEKAPFPPPNDEPCFLLPYAPRPCTTGELRAAQCRLGRSVLPLAAPGQPAGGPDAAPDPHLAVLARRIHTRVAHPVHAAALAVQVLTGRPVDSLRQLRATAFAPSALGAVPAGTHVSVPAWAADLVEAARCFRDLDGRAGSLRFFRLTAWDRIAVDEAAQACGLVTSRPLAAHTAPGTGRARLSTPTAVRS
ncbi:MULTISPECIES: hypothetical protein [unclassified Streptomyces]|uniref:hypothetical protein n=1 Tax=unclassified Streptomyces TaxID=2593676 RepID=UPI003801C6A4